MVTAARHHRRLAPPLATALVLLIAGPHPAIAGDGRAPDRNGNGMDAAPTEIALLVGRSTVVRSLERITRVSLPTPDVADALVTSAHEILVHAKTPGRVSLLVWGESGRIQPYEVLVRRDLGAIQERMRQIFPGEAIAVMSNGADLVLSGVVSTRHVVGQAAALAAGYVESEKNVVNLLRQDGGASLQILLQVRFAEVSRTALQELGGSLFTGPAGRGDFIGRVGTQQFAEPDFDDEKGLVFSDFLNLFAFNTREQLGTVIRALQSKGLFQSLAEPNVITQDGQEASFLAGGEYPYPVLQGAGNAGAVTIVFKEFGVRLRFTPTVVSDGRIHLKVAPEVSALDFGNAVTVEGFRVPALSTRRTETQVELADGQTFAIAGLLDNTVTETMSKIPGLGDIPILGYLFKSRAYQKRASELVVMITPHIVRRNSPGVTDRLPPLAQPYLPPSPVIVPTPPPAYDGVSR
ncbi:MAG: type II and III secretion system protein family protein [Acidimicrobiia bacterium]|nr:type II and III secretion system protein family protein [Acidimicrobiia bacterium]